MTDIRVEEGRRRKQTYLTVSPRGENERILQHPSSQTEADCKRGVDSNDARDQPLFAGH